ncbi:MAG: 23S rRNA (guanosine(2251)-2'-O)-methyltransferase RlmB [Candidatus Midichloria mitochondrii]|uniref:RNA methyltransferase n=1 Tax=Midichloria mitochondrii (strain IricVA) TaxID=696127 RepID=F7XVE0_MIDMI|nr:23S rRNA (guanosine(2251)-2'-O)-methyltransferase RlmB [Candidatus Midichloria mitochondrii]AEI88639.1 RNA methyltransferase [Candidatus Midichloria mitochondrii IricVA]MDJ1256582.1 23S rRNA (guanosine(2251)-2'-O)-methyltransferase RlmB [Candidatus Midichloria mitochondrii]MDJ1288303.1 23S rRNA (guanosine(2251)-2'-O)-methyltransferase RlmB [Candidatus Midichloria mitochondrii]MDJ1299167.1 23S rRNA (guanosine(2251)-2'-O)-methyltransferase RlmB [Candidatus Midichloria mitochondrii]
MEKNTHWLYGKHNCLAVLKNPNRLIKKILVTKSNRRLVPSTFVNKTEVIENKQLAAILKNHDAVIQGIAVLTELLKQPGLDNFIDINKAKRLVVILDQILDPQNVGGIFRSAAAFSVDAVMTTIDNSPHETPSLTKSAAGTFELIPFIRVVNLVQSIEILKKHGFWVIGLDGEAENYLNTFNPVSYNKIVLVLGSEEKGLRPLTKKHCDFILKIPMNQAVESLNVSCAAAIALYHLSIK